MSLQLTAKSQPAGHSFTPVVNTNLIQRKCDCGKSPGLSGECAECQSEKLLGDHASVVQPKLKIGQPNDKYEQEADRVADEVMRMEDSTIQREFEPQVHEGEEHLQKKEQSNRMSVVTPEIQNQINTLRTGGRPLQGSLQSFYNKRICADLTGIRIHTEPAACEVVRSLNARAFTLGSDIFFGQGEFQPFTTIGKRLLAHEITHILQQNRARAPSTIRRAPPTSSTNRSESINRRKFDITVFSGDKTDPAQSGSESIVKHRLKSGETNFGIPIMTIDDIHNKLQLLALQTNMVSQERIEEWKEVGNSFLVPDNHPGFVNRLSIIGHGQKGTENNEAFYAFGGIFYKTTELEARHRNGLDLSRYMSNGGTVILEGCDAAAGDAGHKFLFQIGQIFFGSKKTGQIIANTGKTTSNVGLGFTVTNSVERNWPKDFSNLMVSEHTRHERWSGGGFSVLLTWLSSGEKVLGSYGSSGVITGEIVGNRIQYDWRDKSAKGKGHWTLSADTNQLKGTFGYDESDINGGQWNLVKQ